MGNASPKHIAETLIKKEIEHHTHQKKRVEEAQAQAALKLKREADERKRLAAQQQRAHAQRRVRPVEQNATADKHGFGDVLQESLKDKTVLVSSISGGAVGLLAGGENRILMALLGASAPVLVHVMIEMQQPMKPKLIKAHAGTFSVVDSHVVQVHDGHY